MDDINGIQSIYGSRTEFPIIGDYEICYNSNKNYKIDCISDNVDITWSVSANLQIVSGQGDWDVTIKAIGNGEGTLTATISTGCDNIMYSKDIQIRVGIPDYTLLDIKDDQGTRYLNACDLTNGEASYSGSTHIDEYEWDIPYSDPVNWYVESVNSPFTPYETVEIDYYEDPPPFTEAIRVRAGNECGWSLWQEKTWTVIDQCISFTKDSAQVNESNDSDASINPNETNSLNIELYPTVSNNEIQVQWTEGYNDRMYKISVFDRHGKLVREMPNISTNQYDLTVYDLPSGLYFCRVNQGRIISWKRFVVIK